MKWFLIAALALSSVAFAQPKRVTEIRESDWEPDIIPGQLTAPDIAQVDVTKGPRHDSLLKTRKDFREKVLNSVSDLR